MSTVSLEPDDYKILDELRRKIPGKTQTMKATAGLVINFAKSREKEFVEFAENSSKPGTGAHG